jgi:hypothetical protein
MTVIIHDASGIKKTLRCRFERKYYLTPDKVETALFLLRRLCRFAWLYPFEQINSLYFDTPGLDQYEGSESGDLAKNKVRLRWYGQNGHDNGMQTVFIELKSRIGFASTKQRRAISVPANKLSPDNLNQGIISQTLLLETLAGFGFFPVGPLQPIVAISYFRHRFTEPAAGQALALDSRISSRAIAPLLAEGQASIEIPGAVLEIKGTNMELPEGLRKLRMLDMDWGRFSKYAACIDAHREEPGIVGYLSPNGKVIDNN